MGFFLQFRQETYRHFKQVFGEGEEQELGFGQINLSEKWGWYNSLYMLANEDILKINKVTKLPVYEVLTFMTYKQDLNEKLENERRQHKI